MVLFLSKPLYPPKQVAKYNNRKIKINDTLCYLLDMAWHEHRAADLENTRLEQDESINFYYEQEKSIQKEASSHQN